MSLGLWFEAACKVSGLRANPLLAFSVAYLRQATFLLSAARSELERATFAAPQANTSRPDGAGRDSSSAAPSASSSRPETSAPSPSVFTVPNDGAEALSTREVRSPAKRPAAAHQAQKPSASALDSDGAVSHDLSRSTSTPGRTEQANGSRQIVTDKRVSTAGSEPPARAHATLTKAQTVEGDANGGNATKDAGSAATTKKPSSSGYRQSALSFTKVPAKKGESGSASPVLPMKRLAEDPVRSVARGSSSSSSSTAKASASSKDKDGASSRPQKKIKTGGGSAVVVISDSESD